MTLAEVPLDAPIPTAEALYVWDEAAGYWVTWMDYVFKTLNGDRAAARRRCGDDAAIVRPSAQPSLFG